MEKIDDVFINLDHHGFKEAVVKRITMVDLLDNEMSSLLDSRLKDEIKNLQQENTILKKALELACVPRDDWNCKEPKRIKYTSNYDFFIEQAKESIKDV